MTSVKFQIKEELKQLAKDLRIQKKLFKSKQRNGEDIYPDLHKKYLMRWEYRHRHIACSLLRGTLYECIESRVREDNKPDMNLVEKYKQEYSERISNMGGSNE